MEDLTGRQFGPYRIVAPLGEGGMASVYKAYQPNMDRFVALKVLPSYFARDPLFVARFEQEAKVLAKLQHPHILPVHDFGETDGYTYIVMPFVETGSLAERLESGPVPLPEVHRIIAQVGSALDYAHSRGVVHRDVKPSNILVDSQGNCLLTDFGIAKIVEGTTAYTQTGGTLGTPTYMSPEQIRGEKLDGRSDIYSLGVLLYEMATGRPPFRAETPPAIFVKHLMDPLPPPHVYNPDIPAEAERAILKALAKDREDRFNTAGDLSAALARGMGGQQAATVDQLAVGPALPPAPRRLAATETMPAPKKVGRRPLLNWVIGVVGVLILAALGTIVVGAIGGGWGTRGEATQPPATVVAGPVSSPEPTKTTALPTETSAPPPTSAPTETALPEPTATRTPTRTPTARPSRTPMPTPTMMPTRTPVPTARPTLAPTVPPPQVVSLFRWCGTEYTVEAGRRIDLRYGGWVALGADVAEQNGQHLTVELLIDGQPVTGYRLPAAPLAQLPCGAGAAPEGAFIVLRSATVGPLTSGAHSVQATFILDEAVSDGYDYNGDGQPDFIGPGVLTTQSFTLIVP